MSKTIRLMYDGDLEVDATVGVFTGKPLVVIHPYPDFGKDINLRPIEAERLAKALQVAAATAREK